MSSLLRDRSGEIRDLLNSLKDKRNIKRSTSVNEATLHEMTYVNDNMMFGYFEGELSADDLLVVNDCANKSATFLENLIRVGELALEASEADDARLKYLLAKHNVAGYTAMPAPEYDLSTIEKAVETAIYLVYEHENCIRAEVVAEKDVVWSAERENETSEFKVYDRTQGASDSTTRYVLLYSKRGPILGMRSAATVTNN